MIGPLPSTFGSALRDLRSGLGMKATTLARRASTSRSTVSNIENGRRGASPEIAERLAAVLGVTVEYLSRGGQV